MLAEFKYGLEPKETFSSFLGDQAIPRTAYYYLKKDFFPFVYWNYLVRPMISCYLALANPTCRSRALGLGRLLGLALHSASKSRYSAER